VSVIPKDMNPGEYQQLPSQDRLVLARAQSTNQVIDYKWNSSICFDHDQAHMVNA
jgi:hypothetical protein